MCVRVLYFLIAKKREIEARYKIHEREREDKYVRKTHTHTHLRIMCLRHTRYEINPRER